MLEADEFPIEPASRSLERIREERGKIRGAKTRKSEGQKINGLLFAVFFLLFINVERCMSPEEA